MDFDKKAREQIAAAFNLHIPEGDWHSHITSDDFAKLQANVAAALREAYNQGLEDAARIADGSGCISRAGLFTPSEEIAIELRAKKVPT